MASVGPWCRDYSTLVTARLLFILLLWIWYGLTPYYLPLGSLWLLSLLALAYALYLFSCRRRLLAWLILLAGGLNAFLISYVNPELNLYVTILITAILLYDVVEAPQKACEE